MVWRLVSKDGCYVGNFWLFWRFQWSFNLKFYAIYVNQTSRIRSLSNILAYNISVEFSLNLNAHICEIWYNSWSQRPLVNQWKCINYSHQQNRLNTIKAKSYFANDSTKKFRFDYITPTTVCDFYECTRLTNTYNTLALLLTFLVLIFSFPSLLNLVYCWLQLQGTLVRKKLFGFFLFSEALCVHR